MKRIYILLTLLILGLVCCGVIWWKMSPEVSRVKLHDTSIRDVKSMVRLCSVDLYEDVPVKGSIGPRHIFARMALNGSISFDIEKLQMDASGDTVRVVLPPEIVEVYESTERDAYQVIDTWNDNFFGSSSFTAAEENVIKAKVCDSFRRAVYARGYVRRARAEAVTNLASLLSTVMKRPVIVTDPTPGGSLRNLK